MTMRSEQIETLKRLKREIKQTMQEVAESAQKADQAANAFACANVLLVDALKRAKATLPRSLWRQWLANELPGVNEAQARRQARRAWKGDV